METIFPLEQPAIFSEVRHVSIAEMAARVVKMENDDALQNRKDVDRRVERERAIGEQMMRDFRAIAASCGVEVPEKIGGQGGWLQQMQHSKVPAEQVLRARWLEYKALTQWGTAWFSEMFKWGYAPEARAVNLAATRKAVAAYQNRGGPLTALRTKLRRLLNENGEKAVIEFIERGFKDA